jgi:hypothetical protein
MRVITAAQVRDSCQRNGIRSVRHHECCFCHYVVGYDIQGDRLYFDPGCDCVSYHNGLEPREWSEAAEWINMQATPEERARIAALFGIVLESSGEVAADV